MDLATTRMRRINMPSWIRKIRKRFEKESSAETPSTQAVESIHANVHADYYKSIEKARLKAELMKAKAYAMYDRQRRRLL